MANTFDTEYGVTPWAALDQNEHTVYVPELLENYAKRSVFYKMIDYAVNLRAQRTKKIVYSQLITPEANIASLDMRALWLPDLYVDSRSIEVTTSRYGDKVMLHKYDDYITQWKLNGQTGLRAIMDGLLAPHMVESLDLLARNAFLNSHFKSFANGRDGFAQLNASDTFEESVARGVQLASAYSDLEDAPIFCITSPAAVYTLKNQTLGTGEWITRQQYANPSVLVNYEMGTYEGVRFVQNKLLTLWNCGPILKQATIGASIALGDGSPDPTTTKVDGVWMVGQEGATHGITFSDVTGVMAAGDVVTLHTTRNATGDSTHILNGVQFDHANNVTRRIVEISGSTMRFDKPILTDAFQTDLGGGVYGYITLARPIHVALFIKGPRSVVAGVTQPPQTYTPPAIDDTEAIHRFSWDAYIKYQLFYSDRVEVYFYCGPVGVTNTVVTL